MRTFIAIDRERCAIGLGEIIGGGPFGAFGRGAIGSKGHVARRSFVGPDFEFRNTSTDAAFRIARSGRHGEFDEAGVDGGDLLFRQECVGLGPAGLACRQQFLRFGFHGLGQVILRGDYLGALGVEGCHGTVEGLLFFLGHDRPPAVHDAFESGAEAVVVLGRDGVEFMIMTAGAIDGETEEGAAGGGDHIIQRGGTDVLCGDGVLIADIVIGAGDQEGAPDFDGGLVLADDVAGEMLAHELVEGLVIVQRTDDVVAEGIEVIDDKVAFEAVTLAEADDVEPVATPMLAVARGGEQAVDQCFGRLAGIGLVGGDEGVDLGLGGRKTGQVIAEPADERLWLGGRAARQFLLGQLGVDETVDVGVREFFGQGLE